RAIIKKYDQNKAAYKSLINKLSAIIGKSKDAKTLNRYIEESINIKGEDEWQSTMLEGLARGLRSRESIPKSINEMASLLIHTCLYDSIKSMRKGALQILQEMDLPDPITAKAMHNAKRIIVNKDLNAGQRAYAISFLSLNDPKDYQSLLKKFINPKQPLQIQLSALSALLQIPGTQVSEYMIKNWGNLSPNVRSKAISMF